MSDIEHYSFSDVWELDRNHSAKDGVYHTYIGVCVCVCVCLISGVCGLTHIRPIKVSSRVLLEPVSVAPASAGNRCQRYKVLPKG